MTCREQACLRFVNNKYQTNYFPWNTTGIISASGNEAIVAAQVTNQSNPLGILASIDFHTQQIKWGKASQHNIPSALYFDSINNRTLTASSNSLGTTMAMFNQDSGALLWEYLYSFNLAAIGSFAFNPTQPNIKTYITAGVTSDHKIAFSTLNMDGSVRFYDTFFPSGTSSKVNTVSDLAIDSVFHVYFGGSAIQSATGQIKAMISSANSLSHTFMGGDESQIKKLLINNDILYGMGDITGLLTSTKKSTSMLIKMDAYRGTLQDAALISSVDSEDVYSHALLTQSLINHLELVVSVGNQTAIISINEDTFTPNNLPSGLIWSNNILSSLGASSYFMFYNTMSFSANPTDIWSNARNIAGYTPSEVIYAQPSAAPTLTPTEAPVIAPSSTPTEMPSEVTSSPTPDQPTNSPTKSEEPNQNSSVKPSKSSTKAPTKAPTQTPTAKPSQAPTKAPTQAPSVNLSQSPTKTPTKVPTKKPSKAPTEAPSAVPTAVPSAAPTPKPTHFTLDRFNTDWIIGAGCIIGAAALVALYYSNKEFFDSKLQSLALSFRQYTSRIFPLDTRRIAERIIAELDQLSEHSFTSDLESIFGMNLSISSDGGEQQNEEDDIEEGRPASDVGSSIHSSFINDLIGETSSDQDEAYPEDQDKV
ncbi:MAG: hypothetical protein K2W94_06790 [Alphaproteobacteria bacterium]|nr:hypothetical protein [Alphaproteobacteria bacterium]